MPQNHEIEVHAARLLSTLKDVDAAYLGEVTSILAANHYGMTNRVVSVHHAAWFWHCEVALPDRVHNGVLQYSRHVGAPGGA